ncbi:hypothetical protein PITC_080480 [Penicillium italicum]|uniref:Uncharacterized protein n=1 Tax=Penicillium italicum TaxID=40296 RepID=A0A0A2KW47_PENIT|nr:hypothetical protein PITC_080480 [Penicillium italicum]
MGFPVSGLSFQTTPYFRRVWKFRCEASYILQHFDLGTDTFYFGVIL